MGYGSILIIYSYIRSAPSSLSYPSITYDLADLHASKIHVTSVEDCEGV